MPHSAIVVQLPQPCQQSWAAMAPTATGRHCAACQKVVVDFTQKTDGEILAYLARAGAAPCGRFRAGQLARPLQPAATTSRWRGWLASVLALGGVLSGGRAAGQGLSNYFSAGPAPTVASPASSSPPAPATTPGLAAAPITGGVAGPLPVRGVVLDAASGEPLPGVMVLLKGTTEGVSTDTKGEFALALPAHTASSMLVVSSIGYMHQELAVASLVGAVPATIRLAADTVSMGEVVVVGGYATRKPWPWHPRRLYQWGKYQLARPFRQ